MSDSEISDVSPVDSDVEGQQEKSYDRCVCVCVCVVWKVMYVCVHVWFVCCYVACTCDLTESNCILYTESSCLSFLSCVFCTK